MPCRAAGCARHELRARVRFWCERSARATSTRADTQRCRMLLPSSTCSADGLRPELKAALDKFVTENKVVLFMKGTKQFPQARSSREARHDDDGSTLAPPRRPCSHFATLSLRAPCVVCAAVRLQQHVRAGAEPDRRRIRDGEHPGGRVAAQRAQDILLLAHVPAALRGRWERARLRACVLVGLLSCCAAPLAAGEFFGGCDITVAAFQDGSLQEKLEAAANS